MEKLTLSRYLHPCPLAARYSSACPHYLPLTVSPPRVSWADCAPRVTALVCAPRRVRGGGAGQGRARSHEWAHFYCSQPSPAQPDSVLYTRNCSRFTLWACRFYICRYMMNRCKANYQLNNNKEWYELYFGSCGRIGREVDEMAGGGIAMQYITMFTSHLLSNSS